MIPSVDNIGELQDLRGGAASSLVLVEHAHQVTPPAEASQRQLSYARFESRCNLRSNTLQARGKVPGNAFSRIVQNSHSRDQYSWQADSPRVRCDRIGSERVAPSMIVRLAP